ncbi:MAG TPA: tetratricopeptide repeat protein [Blastocatellia bacterium]|nr:tetratricopeptide repeat protein [Blastocatellia bacterium]
MSRIPNNSQSEVIGPIHRIFHTSQSEIVRLGRRIGIGAEGAVHEIRDKGDLVAKIYHEPPPEKGEKLVVLSRLGADRLFNLSAWPVDVLRDAPDGSVVGFLMKRISGAEEVHALHSPKSRLQKFPEASWTFLIYVAANIARAVAAIHEHGLVIGDVNPKNILVTRKATVYLLDVDSFQVSADGKTYRCDGGFPEYTPPEMQGVAFRDVDRTQEHDCFGLAVVVFQLLFMGRHPFSGSFLGAGEMPLERAIRESRFAYGEDAVMRKMRQPPGTLSLDAVPSALVDLFRRAFLTTDRPRPREWVEPLDDLAKSLKKCALHSGHYYYKRLSECPWCGIENHARVRLFNFLLPGGDSRRGHFRLDEIWKGIEDAEIPDSPMIRTDKLLKAPKLSADVAAAVRMKITGLIGAIVISAGLSFLFGLRIDPPLSFIMFAMLAIISRIVFRSDPIRLDNLQTIFQSSPSIPNDPLVQEVRARHLEAEGLARRLQEQYDREAGNERWGARRDELRDQKETYENLSQIRQSRLLELEAEARKNQLDEFLDQFEINEAESKGVILPPIKKALLSHGVKTAADVVEELKQIPSVGRSQAERLLKWRRDLERGFIFDSAKSVSHEARIKVEQEIDALRIRLESELSGGAYYLKRVRQEIETSREKLKPALLEALQGAAQAERDWRVVIKRNSFTPILFAAGLAFLIGIYMRINLWSGPGFVPADSQSPAMVVLPPSVGSSVIAQPDPLSADKYAVVLYNQGLELSRNKKFGDAVSFLKAAVERDGRFSQAYELLGSALYHLGRYDEAAEELKTAIRLRNDFGPYYSLGLVYIAQERWDGAKTAFENAVSYCNLDSWEESHTLAYYYLGRSKTMLREGKQSIAYLEERLKHNPELTRERLELGSLYLWTGRHEAAKAQYKTLKGSDQALAEELMKLIIMHEARKPTR